MLIRFNPRYLLTLPAIIKMVFITSYTGLLLLLCSPVHHNDVEPLNATVCTCVLFAHMIVLVMEIFIKLHRILIIIYESLISVITTYEIIKMLNLLYISKLRSPETIDLSGKDQIKDSFKETNLNQDCLFATLFLYLIQLLIFGASHIIYIYLAMLKWTLDSRTRILDGKVLMRTSESQTKAKKDEECIRPTTLNYINSGLRISNEGVKSNFETFDNSNENSKIVNKGMNETRTIINEKIVLGDKKVR